MGTEKHYWILNNLERAEKNAAAPDNASVDVELYAMKRETADFQIVVRGGPCMPVVIYSLTLSDLTGDAGTIPAQNASLYREHFVFVPAENHSCAPADADHFPDSGDCWYPDALIPFAQDKDLARYIALPYTAAPGENAAFWVDYPVPDHAGAGSYTGKYTIETNHGEWTGAIRLTVWNGSLPKDHSLWTSVSLHTTDSDDVLAMNELLHHGMNLSNALPAKTYLRLKGQRYADAGFWGNISYGETSMAPPPSEEEVSARVKELKSVLGEEIPLLNYTVDEIEHVYENPLYHEQLRKNIYLWRQALHKNGVKLLAVCKPYTDLLDDRDLGGTGQPLVDIFVVLDTLYLTPYTAYERGDSCAEIAARAQAQGCEVWTYTALLQDGSKPIWLLDYAPVNYRIMPGFLNQAIGMTGTLYWTANHWSEEPWRIPWAEPYAKMPGEGMLVYPGEEAGVEGVVPSIRLKWIRDGIVDYDYIQMLRQQGMEQAAMEIVRGVAPDLVNWTKSGTRLMQARIELGRLWSSGEHCGNAVRGSA